ncbi:MAG: S41 family peptidase [Phycisphaerales bacterium]
MEKHTLGRLVTLAASLVLVLGGVTPAARAGAPGASPPPETIAQLSDAVWERARTGAGETDFAEVVRTARLLGDATPLNALRDELAALEASFAKREEMRRERTAAVEKELTEALNGDGTPLTLSKGIKAAVELFLLTPKPDRPAFLQQDRMKSLIRRADAAAHQSERTGEWVMANELFVRLNLLLEEDGTYKPDARRILDRLQQIRLYVPQRLWEMRNVRRIQDNLKPLPPYNPAGDDWRSKLEGVDQDMVKAALRRAAEGHIERLTMRQLLIGGLESVRNLATTTDLKAAFPGLADEEATRRFVSWIEGKVAQFRGARSDPDSLAFDGFVSELLGASRQTVRIPEEAILHELGNGAFDRLDEFSGIIWPDELPRFRRIMEGEFIGVGIQIQLDEETQMIKVVTPIEGTPAFHGGVKTGDLLKKIDETSAVGMTLDQAVDLITGRRSSRVVLTMERGGDDVEIPLVRERIPLHTVKGWRRTGPKEGDWDWFIDPKNRIGYVRVTNFQDDTTHMLRRALDSMKRDGVAGLILDLRFNPGGLLTQAVSVSNCFIDSGTVVYTEAAGGIRTDTQKALPSRQSLRDVPLVVLVNEGSASASEIVSGAIRHYADTGRLKAMVIGQRTYGKGSVQNVLNLAGDAMLKLTMQYYFLPNGVCIHRREHAKTWGVDPNLEVEMLPQQTSDALTLRQEADTPTAWMPGAAGAGKPAPDPRKLLDDGLDLQLHTALFVLQSQAAGRQMAAGPARDATRESK